MRLLTSLLLLAAAPGCLAPPPPFVVATPYGDVRASSREKAEEVAALLETLAPLVGTTLPGAQERSVEVWVQEKLRVYNFRSRPEGVRGFTLLEKEFRAKRIHLHEQGQASWYLAHELVHALIGSSWSTLPGILEEGLADVIAVMANPATASHIRAHRLLNASSFTGGFTVRITYSFPRPGSPSRDWGRRLHSFRAQPREGIPRSHLPSIFELSRRELHERWPEIPEPFYGVSWIVASRIVERHGLEGLHELCARAEREGREIVPAEWILEAADLTWDGFDPDFLTASFGPREARAATHLEPELYADLVVGLLRPLLPLVANESVLLWNARPALLLEDGSEIPLRRLGFLMAAVGERWHAVP